MATESRSAIVMTGPNEQLCSRFDTRDAVTFVSVNLVSQGELRGRA